jgi:hypothetical protein
MTRKGFMKSCVAGTCGCGLLSMSAPPAAKAADADVDALRWQLDFARSQFAALVGILSDTVDEPTRRKIWEAMGREHGKEYHALAERFKGDIPGFLAEIEKQWVAKAEYDPVAGTIRIIDKAAACSCPLVDAKHTPPEFCSCSIGWQKEVYSIIAGRPVEAALEESILRGGQHCVFRVQIA